MGDVAKFRKVYDEEFENICDDKFASIMSHNNE